MKDTLTQLKKAFLERTKKGRKLLQTGKGHDSQVMEVRIGRRARYIRYHWVLVLFGAAVFYNLFIVSDVYVADTQFYIKSTNENAGVLPSVALLGGGGAPPIQDALLLKSFIESRDMSDALQKRLDLRAHYTSDEWDFLSRLSDTASEDTFQAYYREKVGVSISSDSTIIRVRVRAFTPEFAQEVVTVVVDEATKFINDVSKNIAQQETQFIEGELERARKEVEQSQSVMLAFQAENELLDPSVTGAAIQTVVNEMESELVRLEAEEKILSSYLQADAAELVAVQARIDGLKRQLEQERAKFANQGDRSINQVNARFQELQFSFQFATDVYKVALEALERARVESYRNLKHLVVIQSPRLPDEAAEPRKLYNLATLFVVLNLVYGIAAMIIATIREHRDV